MTYPDYEPDYDGDFGVFERQLRTHGITKEEFDVTMYCGLTYRELQSRVNYAIAVHEAKKNDKV